MTEPASASVAHRPTRGRSPSYPGVSLDVPIARARVVYEKEGRHPAPIGAITGHWGYKSSGTGPASVTYAALLKFGLLNDEGTGINRLAKLTQLALDIILKPEPADEIRTAALLPPIHAEMWQDYGLDLPSDESLRYKLVAQRGFTEKGCQDFIRQYRETLTFAKLSDPSGSDGELSDSSSQGLLDAEAVDGEPQPNRQPTLYRRSDARAPNVTAIPIPLIGGKTILIEGAFPVSQLAWTQFIAVLRAMEPGLVSDSAGAGDDE